MKQLLVFSTFLIYSISFSQVAIGNLDPNPHAQLDVSGEKKGVLIPRITLIDVMLADPFDDTVNPIPESLLIYNTGIGTGVVAGYYYWYNNRWNKIIIQSDPDTTPTTNNLESFENTMTSTVNGIDATAPIINTVSTILDPATTAGYPLTTSVNGIVTAPVDIPEPWNLARGSIKASSNDQDIYMNGKVGIGPAPYNNPTAWLDVRGDAIINGLTVGRGKNQSNTNTAVGIQALSSNNTGPNNTAVGSLALKAVNSSNNTAVGYEALSGTIEGYGNTAVGMNAFSINITGIYNTAIGYNSGAASLIPSNTDFKNTTAIGYDARVSTSNMIRLGNADVLRIEGAAPYSNASDRRWKDNIKTIPLGLDFINKIRPVEYRRKNNEEKTKEWGVIAQELQQAIENAGYHDAGVVQGDNTPDNYLSVRYTDLIAPLIKAVQELSLQNEALKKKNDQMEHEINEMKKRIK